MNENQLRPICEVLAQMTTGSNISYMLLSLGISCDLDDNATKWRRIYNAIVINWNKFHTNDMLIKIIEWIMSPALYIDKQERFNEGRDALNQRLSFLGLELLSNGKIQSRPVATTLDEANQTINKLKRDLQRFDIHPQILTFCRPEIINEDLFHLIFEASKCLLEELRNLSDLTTDGNTLVNQCFDGNNPLIVMNKLSTDDEKSEHKGLQTLLNAIVYLYRNPKAHHLKYFCDDTYQSTLEALIIISRARYALGKCFRNNARYRQL